MQRDLVERARAGDPEAFTALVESRLNAMFRIAMAILGTEADARDATQEAWILIWQRFGQLRDVERFDAWSTRILVNACRTTTRRRRATVREIPMLAGGDHRASSGRDDAERIARLDVLERAFERLAVQDRAILALHHLEDRPVAQIGALLSVPEGTVKSRLHGARQALARALELEER
jgi:RNA polymerase sigma-70 factor (ECF subfamily)